MREKDLPINRDCHVVYTKACKKQMQQMLAKHYPPEEREAMWEKFQQKYVDCLKTWRTDLGGKKNFHNGKGGTYDSIAQMCFWDVCREKISPAEIGIIEENLILPSFRMLRFANGNRPFWKKLMHASFAKAKKRCDVWHDYDMHLQPFDPEKPIVYDFTSCPVAEFAKQYGYTDVVPYLCNVDYPSLEQLHLRLIRTGTCVDCDRCDYCIIGDKDTKWLEGHEEYVDEAGFRRNRK